MAQQDQRLEQLKQKYQSVLNAIQQSGVRLDHVHVQDNKLFIQGTAPSEDVKNRIWDQIKLGGSESLGPDRRHQGERNSPSGQAQTAGAAVSGGGGRRYTVKAGDTLSKISREFYGEANQYMKIFNANRDKLQDPDKIQPGRSW